MSKLIIVVGDQGCGKRRIGKALAGEFGLPVVDGWDGVAELPPAAVAITNVLGVTDQPGAVMVRVG